MFDGLRLLWTLDALEALLGEAIAHASLVWRQAVLRVTGTTQAADPSKLLHHAGNRCHAADEEEDADEQCRTVELHRCRVERPM